MQTAPVALVTGANRGIGRAIAVGLAKLGHNVLLGVRRQDSAEPVLQEIASMGASAEPLVLDVGDLGSIKAAAAAVAERHPRLDVLVNNAGILLGGADEILAASREAIDESLRVNAFGPLETTRAFLPLLRKAPHPRVVNVSSALGSLAESAASIGGDGWAAAPYRLSKVLLNAVTVLLARELHADRILVNTMSPGWVRTEMGGPEAPRTPEEGADTALWLATLPDDGPTGGFFRDRAALAW